ncbi:MAG TPA: hypothetical protein VG734_19690 [Lacunisphaera sp.]|nr:hypothetical protein [Lacunisphaera sp.]
MAPESTTLPRGSSTLVALMLTTALGVAVGSYLALISHGQQMGIRQFQNDRADELAQVGLEEALWALNQDNWSGSGPAGNTPWTTAGTTRSVILDYGSLGHGATGQVALSVANYASTGPVWPTVAVTATVTLNDGRAISRTLQATTGPAPLFANAIASAEAGVSFAAGGTVDSWNSDPDDNPATAAVAYSFTAGNAANYGAVVAGRDDGTYGVVLTQATVRGYVATFGQPASYSVSGSPPGRILGPTTASGVDIDNTRLGRTAFVPFAPVFSVTLPATSGPTYGGLLSSLLSIVTTLLVGGIPSGVDTYRYSGNLSLNGGLVLPLIGPPANLTVDRPLKLIVDGNLVISGTGSITIKNTGSLELFVAGDVTIGGNGIINENVEPAKCAIYCTSTSTTDSLQYTTTADYRGVIYCENKPIDISSNATFYGAMLSRKQIRFTGGATAPIFHYDTALRTTRFSGIKTPYVVRELTQP